MAYFYRDDDKSPYQLAISEMEVGAPKRTFSLCSTCGQPIAWAPDGRSLVYTETSPNGVGNLVAQPINGGEPKKITNYRSERISSFGYSRDGKQIAISRGSIANDVLLYTNILK